MNHSVAIPANWFQVVDSVGATMRAISSMMNLQRPICPTTCAAPFLLLHGDSTVQHVYVSDERFQRNPVDTTGSFQDEVRAVKRPERY